MQIYYISFIIFSLPPAILGRPQVANSPSNSQQYQQTSGSSTPIPIVSQTEIVGGDGSFNFSYETGNGIRVQESGFVKQNQNARSSAPNPDGSLPEDSAIQVVSGAYSYTAPDGTVINLSYTADENGFQPVGAHLPTAPPVPADLQRSLSLLPNISSQQGTNSNSQQISAGIQEQNRPGQSQSQINQRQFQGQSQNIQGQFQPQTQNFQGQSSELSPNFELI